MDIATGLDPRRSNVVDAAAVDAAAVDDPRDADGRDPAVATRILWHWSTGDTLADVAECTWTTEEVALDALRRHGALGPDGRDVAGAAAARLLDETRPRRWIAVEPDVVAIALDRDEEAEARLGRLLDEHGDLDPIEAFALCAPILRGLSRALSPDLPEDGHRLAAGRPACTVGRDALLTSRTLAGLGVMASAHRASTAHGLLFVETMPDAWLLASRDGGRLQWGGAARLVEELAREVARDVERTAT